MSALTFHRYRNRSLCALLGSPVTLMADLFLYSEAVMQMPSKAVGVKCTSGGY